MITKLDLREFTSSEKLNDYVTAQDYELNALCFAIKWDKYDISDPDAPVYNLEFMTKFEQFGMTDPTSPQGKYFNNFYHTSALGAYFKTDLIQVMTSTTKVVIDNEKADAGDFSLLYTPMDTGEYT